jgi:hypothetical protein
MALSSKHPSYSQFEPDWTKVRDTLVGERRVKEKGTDYLHATSGMLALGLDGRGYDVKPSPDPELAAEGRYTIQLRAASNSPGLAMYEAYVRRAVFHEIPSSTLEAQLGAMHRKPPTIELPPELEPLRDDCTQDRETLEMLLVRLNSEQISQGRVGLMLDVRGELGPDALPYFSLYVTESVGNWGTDKTLSPGTPTFVVLNESGQELAENLSYKEQERYLVLADTRFPVAASLASVGVALPPNSYVAAVKLDDEASGLDFVKPEIAGQGLEEIPFVSITATDLGWEPAKPPLLPVVNMSLAIYRGEADYRQTLFMQGQETLITKGLDTKSPYNDDSSASASRDKPLIMGAGGRIDLPENGDASYIGVSAAGLSEMRVSIENDKKSAAEMGAQILADKKAAESGDALETRTAARTATLTTVAKAGAKGVERLLKMAAVWVGADPEKVKVTPNLDFADVSLSGGDILQLMQAKSMGYPVSLETLHAYGARRGLTEKTFEEEMDEIAEEEPLVPPTGDDDGGDGNEDLSDEDQAQLDEDAADAVSDEELDAQFDPKLRS